MKLRKIAAVLALIVLIVSTVMAVREYGSYENPPALNIYCDDIRVNLKGKGISWSYETITGRKAYEASLVHPMELQYEEPLFNTHGDDVKIGFEISPDNVVSARSWSWADIGNAEAEGMPFDIADGTLPASTEGIVYEIVAEWTENKYFSGTARYIFYIEP